ncbi:MAG TPA: hypothetical protein VHM19_13100, partial [Polyangiales bacterium]|nr:hypothetical protein [Polyangiales bacterium]
MPAVVALTVTVSGCKIFKTNCAEDDKTGCLGGGTLRSGDICVRSGDCAVGLECTGGVCAYS